MTIHTHAAVEAPGMPHDGVLRKLVVHAVVLVELVQTAAHHAGGLGGNGAAHVARRIPAGGILCFARLHEVGNSGSQAAVVRIVCNTIHKSLYLFRYTIAKTLKFTFNQICLYKPLNYFHKHCIKFSPGN